MQDGYPYQAALEDLYERWQEAIRTDAPVVAATQTRVDADEEDEDNALERLGINIRPRPQTVTADNVVWTNLTAQDGITILDTNANVRTVIEDIDSLSVNGTMSYNGEEMDARIQRMIDARLATYTDQLDRYFAEVVIPYIDSQLQARREEQ